MNLLTLNINIIKMKQLLATMLIALYEGLSFVWAFAPIKTTLFLGINQDWVFYNGELLGEISCVNLLFAVCMLCFLCYNQGLEDGKQSRKS